MNLFPVYPLYDVEIARGKGCKVWDSEGTEYLDLYGGHAVISIGHSHPHYIEKIQEQLAKIAFYSNSVKNSIQENFAARLGKVCGYDDYSLFLVNSGAEANENALKLASFHTGRRRVIAFSKAFHGRTSAAVEVTDNMNYKAEINRNDIVTFVPLGDIAAVETEIRKGDVACVIIEGIQGVGGVQIPSDDFMRQLRKVTEENDVILIADEIQSGYGRSGKFFAHQYSGIRADLVTVAKGIANGFPMSGVLISPKFKAVYGQLGTTFGGNHLACAAATAVLDVMEAENLVENAAKVGKFLLDSLQGLKGVKEVRGRGLMIGIEMEYPAKELRKRLIFDYHVFTGASGTNVIRLLPPLCLTMEEAAAFVEKFKEALANA